jgi:hypothetical protein
MSARLWMLTLVAGLAACGETPQALESNSKDAAAYTGTGKTFVTSGWTQGDKASWASQLKARQQYGQNDYSRTH